MDYPEKLELGNELDLHHFHPKDVKPLLKEFIEISLQKNCSVIRIVHGRGKSVIKSIVHSVLGKNSNVLRFRDEPGNWGATIVYLNKK